MPDKDKDVYGFSSLAEAGIHIGLFPRDLMQEVLVLNREWSETRRKPEVLPPPNDTNAIATVSYYKPGTSMQDNVHLAVRPPKDAGGFYTIEDAARNVLAYGRTLEDIGVEWRRIDTQNVLVEKLVRQGYGNSSGSQLLNFF
jgi:hypothetical protein